MSTRIRAKALFPSFILAGAVMMCDPSAGLASPQYRAVPSRQAATKLAIRSVPEALALGDTASLEVTLLNQQNNPVAATHMTAVVVDCVNPNTKAVTYLGIEIAAGQTQGKTAVQPDAAGLWTLKAHDKESRLLDASNYLLVRPASPSPKRKRAYLETRPPAPPRSRQPLLLVSYWTAPPGPEFEPQAGGGAAHAQPSGRGKLLLVASTRDIGGFLADGKDSADFHAFYEGGGNGAPTDIYVYLRWSNGTLTPTPLVIRKGAQSGDASLVSTTPLTATVSFANSTPPYDVDGDSSFTVRFVQPISGIALVGPERLSLVDNQPLVARFLDQNHVPVQTDIERSVTFTSKTANLHLSPDKQTAKPGSSDAQTVLIPLSIGTAEIEAYIPGYQAVSYKLHVSATAVIVLWMVGGFLGAVCAYGKLKGSMLWRTITGLVAAGLVSWAWVYGALPQIDSQLAHNTLNVLFVSVIGGYCGIAVLDFFAKRLGLAQPAA